MGTSREGNLIILVLSWLACFTDYHVKFMRVIAGVRVSSRFKCWITFHCVAISHFVFSLLHQRTPVASVFRVLWIILLWTWACRPLLSVLLSIFQGEGLLGHMAILLLTFWGTSVLFCTAAAPLTLPAMVCRDPDFSTSSPALAVFWGFW